MLNQSDNQGKRTEAVKQAMLQFIWEHQMREGDRLPSRALLRDTLGAGGATVDRAVKSLVTAGVLIAKQKVGVFIKNTQPYGHPGYNIGFTGCYGHHLSFFLLALKHSAEQELQSHGSRCISYPIDLIPSNYYEEQSLQMFPGLSEVVRRGELDGIITETVLKPSDWKAIEARGVPVCYVGSYTQALSGVMVDVPWFLSAALQELLQSGCRRIALLIGPLTASYRQRVLEILRDGYRKAGVPVSAAELPHSIFSYSYDNFISGDFSIFAHELLGVPEERRPDGLILTDDIMSLSFSLELARMGVRGLSFQPQVISLQNDDLPFHLPFKKMTVYQNELSRLGVMAAKLLMERITSKGRTPAEKVLFYRPVKVGADADQARLIPDGSSRP